TRREPGDAPAVVARAVRWKAPEGITAISRQGLRRLLLRPAGRSCGVAGGQGRRQSSEVDRAPPAAESWGLCRLRSRQADTGPRRSVVPARCIGVDASATTLCHVAMPDDSQIRDVADAAKGVLETTSFYEDAVQPVAKQVGKALETVGKAVNLALAPV